LFNHQTGGAFFDSFPILSLSLNNEGTSKKYPASFPCLVDGFHLFPAINDVIMFVGGFQQTMHRDLKLRTIISLVGGFNPSEKILVELDHFPQVRVKIKKNDTTT